MLFRLMMGQVYSLPKVDGNVNECNSGTQTIQVAWNGGVTPKMITNLTYFSTMLAILTVLEFYVPISIADINDNDNFQLQVMKLLKFQ